MASEVLSRSSGSALRRPLEELGQKGQETRRRLMAAARGLLKDMSAVSLTVAAIARQAKTSPATFYVYFDDVSGVILALAQKASEDLDDVLSALAAWRSGRSAEIGARTFFSAYHAFWDRNGPILVLRNMEADRGDGRFLAARSQSGRAIIRELGAILREGHAAGQLTETQAYARATVIFAALERIAAAAALYPRDERAISHAALNEAQIDILVSLTRN